MVEVDETAATDLTQVALPEGGEIATEHTAQGAPHPYLMVKARNGETPAVTRARLEAWARQLTLPPGTRVVWEQQLQMDDELFNDHYAGFRSYLVRGAPIVTHANVIDASAQAYTSGTQSSAVSVSLDGPGSQAFAAATSRLKQNRIAVIVDGEVLCTPVVLDTISGGKFQITLATNDADKGRTEANTLAARLRAL